MQTIVGVVQSVEQGTYGKDGKAMITIVVKSEEKGGQDKYPEVVAVKVFEGNAKAMTAARNLVNGDVVDIGARVTSKKSEKGDFWNSDVVAVFIKSLAVEPF